jgi:hypothetical protein
VQSVLALFHDRPLVIFLVCAVMFHFANDAMLPLLGEMLAKGRIVFSTCGSCARGTMVGGSRRATWSA